MSTQTITTTKTVECMEVDDQVVPDELEDSVFDDSIVASSAYLPSEDFILWINDVPEKSERIYGKTPMGQWFCLVLITLIEVDSKNLRAPKNCSG